MGDTASIAASFAVIDANGWPADYFCSDGETYLRSAVRVAFAAAVVAIAGTF